MKIKNLKISEDSHSILKKYCMKNGLKIHKFLEKLIEEEKKALEKLSEEEKNAL